MPLPTTDPTVVVDGQPLSALASGWGDLEITHRGLSFAEVSWTIPVRKLRRHQAFLARKPVRVFYGATQLGFARMSEPNWDTGEMTAIGCVRQGEEAAALDATGLLTTVPDTAVDRNITIGQVDWIRNVSFSAAPLTPSGTSDQLNYLTALLDAECKRAGDFWGVNGRRELYRAPRPTTPTWCISPDSGVMGLTDQAIVGVATGRFLVTASTLDTAVVGKDGPEVLFDMTDLGVITKAKAEAVLGSIRDQAQSRPAWTNGLTLSAPQITTPGGGRANLAKVMGNQMFRLQGVRDQRGLDAGTNFVSDEVTWKVADREVEVTPVGLVDRSLQGLAEAAGVKVL